MKVFRQLSVFLTLVIISSYISVRTYAQEDITPLAIWDMANAQKVGASCYLEDVSGNNMQLQAFYGNEFQNGFVSNESFSQQKYAYMPSGPYWAARYNENDSTYNMNDEDFINALEGEYTFETWVKFDPKMSNSALFMIYDSSIQDTTKWLSALCANRTNDNVSLIFRIMFTSGQKYYNVSKTMKTGEWNHIIFSYTSQLSDDPIVYINGEKASVNDVFKNASGGPKKHQTGTALLEIGRYQEANVFHPIQKAYFGRTAFYSGVMSEESRIEAYNTQKPLYENGFSITIENNGEAVKADSVKEGSVSLKVDCSDVLWYLVNTNSVKLYDENENIVMYNGKYLNTDYIIEKDFLGVGNYKLVLSKDIPAGDGGTFRKEDFVYKFSVSESQEYRETIKEQLNSMFSDSTLSDDDIKNNVLNNYNYILKLDVSEGSAYSKIINKTSIFNLLRSNTYESFSDIIEAFNEYVELQKGKDVIEAVKEYNDAVEAKDSQALQIVIFEKYATVFKLDKEKFNSLKDNTKVIDELLKNKASDDKQIISMYAEAVEKCFINERIEDFLKNFSAQTSETVEEYLLGYSDVLTVDFENSDFQNVKSEVFNDILNTPISSVENFENTFYKSVLINCLNKLKIGERERFSELITKYAKYWTEPSIYKNAKSSQKETLIKKITGMNFKSVSEFEDTVEKYMENIINTENNRTTQSDSSGGGMSSSASVKIPSYSADSTVSADVIPATKFEAKTPFKDINDTSWALLSIENLYEKGIINGKTETEFAPNDYIKRSEFSKIISIAFNIKIQSNESLKFEDLSANEWYYEYVSSLYNAKIIKGKSENYFGKDDNLTRADLAVMLKRITQYKDIEIKANESEKFSDDAAIPEYAKEAVYDMKALGVMDGMGENTFAPQNFVTRAQTAKVVDILMSLIK